jgi:hypothetical protein
MQSNCVVVHFSWYLQFQCHLILRLE